MKKALFLGVMVMGLMAFTAANAEMVKGQVISKKGNMIVVKTDEGKTITAQTKDTTTYREKKIMKKDKMKNGKMIKKGDTYYKTLVDEDEWIELTYTPAKSTEESAVVQDVIVYDD